MADTHKNRPVYRNIHISQIVSYRLPLAGIVSILHRVSGALMFLLMPFIIWLFDVSVTSEVSYGRFTDALANPLVKLIVLGLIWAYLHHIIAGVRHLWMDATHSVTREHGRSSAVVTLSVSIVLTLVCAALLFF
jgi:succinate dehydrogenase / fumarate reductase, cytochrome b subunit